MPSELNVALKKLIVEALNLEDVRPEEIPDDEPLFGAGLDLDSIDALELVLRIEKTYGVKIESSEASRQALRTVDTLAAFIRASRSPAS